MATPSMTYNAVGNLLAAIALAASANYAVFADASAKIETQLTPRVTTGGTVAATAGVTAYAYDAYAQTTLSASPASGATSITVGSAAGISVGSKIVVENEMRTVTGVAGTTLTIDALLRTHASGAAVYLVEQTPTALVQLGAAAANTTYSKTLYLPTGKYCLVLTNLDTANAVTVEATSNTIDSFS